VVDFSLHHLGFTQLFLGIFPRQPNCSILATKSLIE
jgi:hypothetical protein